MDSPKSASGRAPPGGAGAWKDRRQTCRGSTRGGGGIDLASGHRRAQRKRLALFGRAACDRLSATRYGEGASVKAAVAYEPTPGPAGAGTLGAGGRLLTLAPSAGWLRPMTAVKIGTCPISCRRTPGGDEERRTASPAAGPGEPRCFAVIAGRHAGEAGLAAKRNLGRPGPPAAELGEPLLLRRLAWAWPRPPA
jgi:hypothetical protein